MKDQQAPQAPNNPFAVSAAVSVQSQTAIASTRAAQEVQAAMVVAKKFPRDQIQAFERIMQACKRKNLAEAAIYTYPRGDTQVEGPSIRLAEAIAQSWGNLDFGIVELEQRDGESAVMAYAWDLETNTRQTKIFTVPHVRYTKKGTFNLEDPRDVYEMVANQGARRLRACILGVVPGDVVEAAVEECNRTMSSGATEPLIDRVRKMAGAFAEIGVTIQMIEKRLGHRLDATSDPELVKLRKIYASIRDGMGSRESFFEPVTVTEAKPAAVEPPNPQPAQETPKPQRARKTPQPETPPPTPAPAAEPPAGAPEVDQPILDTPAAEVKAPKVAALEPSSTTPDGYLAALKAGMADANITEAQLMKFCKDNFLAKPNQHAVSDLATPKLASLCINWPSVISQIRP